MSRERPHRPRQRPRRGRPAGLAQPRSGAGPTQARLLAVRVLERVERARAYADLALHAALGSTPLARADRGLATELVYGTLRWRGRIDYLLAHVLDRDPEKLEPRVLSTLRIGAYQLAFSDRIPVTAAVDQAVRCARAAGADRAAGLVNAVLRRLAAELPQIDLPELDADPLGHLTHALSLPRWIAERWLAQYGAEEAAALAGALNRVPASTVRANRVRIRRDALLHELRARRPDAQPCRYAPDGIVLGGRGHPGEDPAFLEGRFTLQDEASQLVVELLDPRPGEAIADACAAPGAKSTAIAERLAGDGVLAALDRHPRRLGLLRRDARRLGLTGIETLHRDASRPLPELEEGPRFDRVLVDAPCSGLGALRRNPDLRWRLRPEDPGRLAEAQGALLRNAARWLKPGGVLVYSVCTLLPDETEAVTETFLRDSAFRVAPREALPPAVRPLIDRDRAMRCLPHRHGTDGFYAVRMERLA